MALDRSCRALARAPANPPASATFVVLSALPALVSTVFKLTPCLIWFIKAFRGSPFDELLFTESLSGSTWCSCVPFLIWSISADRESGIVGIGGAGGSAGEPFVAIAMGIGGGGGGATGGAAVGGGGGGGTPGGGPGGCGAAALWPWWLGTREWSRLGGSGGAVVGKGGAATGGMLGTTGGGRSTSSMAASMPPCLSMKS